jgi:adenylate kinase
VAPTAFVLVEATPETILDRRAESDRNLDTATERQVEFEQDLNRSAALEYARERDASIYFVENEGSVDDAAEHIATQL